MDHGDQERAVANTLKQTVKRTSRRRVTAIASKRPGPVAKIAPKPSGSGESSSSSPASNGTQVLNPPSEHGSSQGDMTNVLMSAMAVRLAFWMFGFV